MISNHPLCNTYNNTIYPTNQTIIKLTNKPAARFSFANCFRSFMLSCLLPLPPEEVPSITPPVLLLVVLTSTILANAAAPDLDDSIRLLSGTIIWGVGIYYQYS